jgi:hypothetical protein
LVGKQKLHNRPKAGDRQPYEWALPPRRASALGCGFFACLNKSEKETEQKRLVLLSRERRNSDIERRNSAFDRKKKLFFLRS